MPYATQADLVPQRMTLEDLLELTTESDDPAAAQTAATITLAALTEASSVVDSYCSQRYATPLQLSGLVTKITLDLAIFDLASRRRDTQPKETWTQRRDQAMSFLRDVAAGRASLDQPANAAAAQSSSADVTRSMHNGVFDRDNLRGFC